MENVNTFGLNRVLPSVMHVLSGAVYSLLWTTALAIPAIVALIVYFAPIQNIFALNEWLHSDLFATVTICIFVLAWSVQGLGRTGKTLVGRAIQSNSVRGKEGIVAAKGCGSPDSERKACRLTQLLSWNGTDDPLPLIEKLYFPDTHYPWQRSAAQLVLAVLTHEHLELELDRLVAENTQHGSVNHHLEVRFKKTLRDIPIDEFVEKTQHWLTAGAHYIHKMPREELASVRTFVCKTLF